MEHFLATVPVLVTALTGLIVIFVLVERPDLYPRHRFPRVSLVTAFACLKHVTWGVLLFIDPDEVSQVTGVHGIVESFGGPQLTAAILIAATVVVIYSWNKPFAALAMIPQQFILYVIAVHVMFHMVTGTFADGTVRSSIFLITDQLPALLLAVLHTVAIIEKAIAPLQRIDKITPY
jgi:hypothetical protein